MQRLGNPLDGRQALPVHLVAQGGADCTSTTSSSSCVVSAITATVMSARLVGKVEQAASDALGGAIQPSTPARAGIGIRLLAGLIPLLTIIGMGTGLWLQSAIPPVLVYAGLLWAVSRHLPDPGRFVGRHVLLMAGMASLGALEFAAWVFLIIG